MALSDAIATVKTDDERVRITEYRLPPGSHTGWHRHGMAYVVVPTQGGRLRIVSKEGESVAEMIVGQPYSRPVGIEHDVVNDGPGEVAFIEVEIKVLAG
ncbi:MAG: cupin [Alphaproteobacteria bacterium]|nr:cupin [Alphaproteobacteria bacterium]